jgi:predicted DNA-binding protein (UPF0251 family)
MPTKKSSPKQYTITEAANRLGITRAAVHDAIRKKRIRATWGDVEVTIRALLISGDDLKKYRVDLSRQERGKKN